MRRSRLALLSLAVTAIVAAPHAHAESVAIIHIPPFTERTGVLSALMMPCQILDPGVRATSTDPTTGSFAPLSAGITVSNCALHGRTEYRTWDLGPVLAPLVGQPAQVIAVFEGAAIARANGNGNEISAELEVRLGDDSIEGDWQRIVRARCLGDGCAGHQRSGPFVFAQDLEALPASLIANFRSQTHAAAATGHAEATFTGALKYVIVRPLD